MSHTAHYVTAAESYFPPRVIFQIIRWLHFIFSDEVSMGPPVALNVANCDVIIVEKK